jgi:hypothetical protein
MFAFALRSPLALLALALGASRLGIRANHQAEEKYIYPNQEDARCNNPWLPAADGSFRRQCLSSGEPLRPLLPVPERVPTVPRSGLKEGLLPSRFSPLVIVTSERYENNGTTVLLMSCVTKQLFYIRNIQGRLPEPKYHFYLQRYPPTSR